MQNLIGIDTGGTYTDAIHPAPDRQFATPVRNDRAGRFASLTGLDGVKDRAKRKRRIKVIIYDLN